MSAFKHSNIPVPITLIIVIAIVVIGGLSSSTYSAESKSEASSSPTNSAPVPTNSVEPEAAAPMAKASAKTPLTGAELYSMHCNRCHPERYPTERTAAQWKTIMLHMEVRASIPGSQARLILKYLQDNSGR